MKDNQSILIADIVSVADRELGDIERLAKSIREVGLLQPILLRLRDDGKFEVVDGRRRLCAIVKLRWEALPPGSYALCETSEDSALIAHVANTERKPLKPSEELAQLAELAKQHTTEELADRLGRSPGWIARRLKIRDLSEEWRKVLDDPELARAWTLDKLAIIARQPVEVQEELDYLIDERAISLKALEKEIDEETMKISAADFDTSACENCVHNSALQRLLFDDGEEAVCLNAECWARKDEEHYQQQLAERQRNLQEEQSEDSDGSERRDAAPRGEAKKEPTVKEREEALAQKRNKRALELLADFLAKKFSGKEWAARIPLEDRLDHLLNVVRLYGYSGPYSRDYRCHLMREDVIPSTDGIEKKVYDQARHRISMDLRNETKGTLSNISREAGDAVAELCCIIPKWLEIKQQAALEVPEPKVLVEQRAKEKAKK